VKNSSRPPEIATLLVLTLLVGAVLCIIRQHFSVAAYPWLFPDSFDWLVNGLRYSGGEGATFEITHRAMLLPLIFAGLIRCGAENYIVLFGALFHCLTALLVYFLVRRLGSSAVAFWSALFSLFAFTGLGQSAYVGSDIAAHFFLVATALSLSIFSRTGEMRWVTVVLASATIGIHAQYIGVILSPALVLGLFLYDKNGRMACGFARYRQLLLSRSTYIAVGSSALLGALFFLPRLLEFQVLYTERVQHGSLVRFHVLEPLTYVVGLASSFSWPVVLLAVVGAVHGLVVPESRRATSFYLVWVADIFLFFTFLYTWKDVRFLIYLSVPLLILAAQGLVFLFSLLSFKGPRAAWGGKFLKGFIAALVLFYVSSPSTSDPFDYSFALTPWESASFDKEALVKKFPTSPSFYLLSHWREGQAELADRSRPTYDELRYSAPLRAAFLAFHRDSLQVWRTHSLFYWSPNIPPADAYIVGNRNTLYADKAVKLVSSIDDLLPLLQGDANVLVFREADFALLAQRIAGVQELAIIKQPEPAFVFVAGSSSAALSLIESGRTPSFVEKVTAPEHPEALFDGILRDPRNFAGAPLGQAIEVDFKEQVAIQELKVMLWDFDGRTYRFGVEGLSESGWSPLGTWTGGGVVTVVLAGKSVRALRFIGEDNSNLAQNPANRMFHILELEITRLP